MKGLRKRETDKFERFFSNIQTEAEKENCVFYAEAGDGNDFVTWDMEGENMMGWLISMEKLSEFEPVWMASEVDDQWSDYFKWAVWSRTEEGICIRFEE